MGMWGKAQAYPLEVLWRRCEVVPIFFRVTVSSFFFIQTRVYSPLKTETYRSTKLGPLDEARVVLLLYTFSCQYNIHHFCTRARWLPRRLYLLSLCWAFHPSPPTLPPPLNILIPQFLASFALCEKTFFLPFMFA